MITKEEEPIVFLFGDKADESNLRSFIHNFDPSRDEYKNIEFVEVEEDNDNPTIRGRKNWRFLGTINIKKNNFLHLQN